MPLLETLTSDTDGLSSSIQTLMELEHPGESSNIGQRVSQSLQDY